MTYIYTSLDLHAVRYGIMQIIFSFLQDQPTNSVKALNQRYNMIMYRMTADFLFEDAVDFCFLMLLL